MSGEQYLREQGVDTDDQSPEKKTVAILLFDHSFALNNIPMSPLFCPDKPLSVRIDSMIAELGSRQNSIGSRRDNTPGYRFKDCTNTVRVE